MRNNDDPKPRSGRTNWFICTSFPAISGCLRIVSYCASTVVSTVRSPASSVVDRDDDASDGQENTRNNVKVDIMSTSTSSQFIASRDGVFCGWIFLMFGIISFLGILYSAIISKLLPRSGNVIISAIQQDRYYCFLVPLTLPILLVAVYFHWLCMRLFKHA